MANALTYQSEFTGPQMDERFAAVAQLQAALTEVETALSAKYVKPASGIPETDMDAAVQSALAKARSAVQDLSNYYTKTEIDALLSAVNSQEYVDVASLPTASASTLGKIYLVGPDSNDQYARYYTSYDGSDYSWVAAGSTEINLALYATKAELNQLDQKVDELADETVTIDVVKGDWSVGRLVVNDKIIYPSYTAYRYKIFDAVVGDVISYRGRADTNTMIFAKQKANGTSYDSIANGVGDADVTGEYTVLESGKYCICGYNNYPTGATITREGKIPVMEEKIQEYGVRLNTLDTVQNIPVTEGGTFQTGRVVVSDRVIYDTYTGYRYMLFNAVVGDIISYKADADTNTMLLSKQDSNRTTYTNIVAGTGNLIEGTYTVQSGGVFAICGYNNYPTVVSITRNGKVVVLENKVQELETKTGTDNARLTNIEQNYIITDLAEEIDDPILNKYVSWADVSIQTLNGYRMTNPIFVKGDSRVSFSAICATTVSAICLCDENGDNRKRAVQGLGTDDIHIHEFIADEDCYVILSWLNSVATSGYISMDKVVGRITDSMGSFGIETDSHLQTISNNPLALVKETPGYAGAIRTWGFVGDSLASGEIWGYKDGQSWHTDNYDISWGQFLCRITGATGKNYSVGGQTAKWWVTNYLDPTDRSLAGVQADGGKQAYIIALGVNDVGYLSTLYNNTVATNMENIAADIDLNTPANNANTFAGWYARVIQEIKAVAPDALIFPVVMPEQADETWANINAVIRSMQTVFAAKYPNTIWTIDLYTYKPSQAYLSAFKMNGAHLNAQGYLYTAWEFMTYIDWLIRKNMSAFKGLCFIGTGAHINNP